MTISGRSHPETVGRSGGTVVVREMPETRSKALHAFQQTGIAEDIAARLASPQKNP
jgi:hypothetical protein